MSKEFAGTESPRNHHRGAHSGDDAVSFKHQRSTDDNNWGYSPFSEEVGAARVRDKNSVVPMPDPRPRPPRPFREADFDNGTSFSFDSLDSLYSGNDQRHERERHKAKPRIADKSEKSHDNKTLDSTPSDGLKRVPLQEGKEPKNSDKDHPPEKARAESPKESSEAGLQSRMKPLFSRIKKEADNVGKSAESAKKQVLHFIDDLVK